MSFSRREIRPRFWTAFWNCSMQRTRQNHREQIIWVCSGENALKAVGGDVHGLGRFPVQMCSAAVGVGERWQGGERVDGGGLEGKGYKAWGRSYFDYEGVSDLDPGKFKVMKRLVSEHKWRQAACKKDTGISRPDWPAFAFLNLSPRGTDGTTQNTCLY